MARQEKQTDKYFWSIDLKKFTEIWLDEGTTEPIDEENSGADENVKPYEDHGDLKNYAQASQKAVQHKQLRVLACILQNINPSDNTVSLTYDRIAAMSGVSRNIVASIMRNLKEKQFIQNFKSGVYVVNPDILKAHKDTINSWDEEDLPFGDSDYGYEEMDEPF